MTARETILAGIRDLRDWLSAVDDMGELQRVDGANWNLEIGGLSELNCRRRPPAALLFDHVSGYPPGYRVLTGSLASPRRIGATLRLNTIFTDRQLVEALRGQPLEWERLAGEYAPVEVKTAPFFENTVEGLDLDLLRFPVPHWHEHDGGRYIGTGCMVLTRDPDSGIVNGGAYRMMVQQNGRSATVMPAPGKHGHQHITKTWDRAERAPIAVSLGHDPVLFMVSATEVPADICELNYAGAMIGRPIEVVPGPITALPLPTSSEIVIEGWVERDREAPEGPFGEWTGYYSGGVDPVPLIHVERLYFRNNPILLGSPPSKPPHDYSYMRAVLKSAMIQDALVKAGLPEVRGVWAHECGGGRMLLAVSIKQRYCGHSRQAGYLTAQCQPAVYKARYIVVVDEDVDPTNLEDVMWAACTRSDPAEDIEIMRKSLGAWDDTMLESRDAPPYNTRALIDACKPFHRIEEFPRVAQASPSFLRDLREKWRGLFADARFPLPENDLSSADADTVSHGLQRM